MGGKLVIGLSAGALAVVAGVTAVLLVPSAVSAEDKPPKLSVVPHLDMAKEVIKEAMNETAGKVGRGAAGMVPGATRPAAPGVAPAAPAGAGTVASPAAPAAAAAAAPPADAASRAASLRKKTLKEDDFVDADETNRDPFKSFLRLFVERVASPKGPKVPAIFERFALEELTLIAVISGDANPRAMFRDPGGLGQTVKRGDYLSKAAARITKILSDRVILELAEATPSGDTKPLEKAILVNPEGAQK